MKRPEDYRKLLKAIALADKPGQNETKVLYSSVDDLRRPTDLLDDNQVVEVELNLVMSHVSADKGIKVEVSDDRGTTWTTFRTLTYRTANSRFTRCFSIKGRDVRVSVAIGAVALTTFRGSIHGYRHPTGRALCEAQGFAVFRAKAAVIDDTAPAKNASKAGETIIIPDGKRLRFFIEVLTAGDAEVADGTADVQFCRFDPGSTYWAPGSDGKRVGCKHLVEYIYDGTGEVWPMLTAHAGTDDAKVNIWGYVEP